MERINIILAEDHSLFRQLLIPALEYYGVFTISEAENGIQLLDLLKKHEPDVIMMDIQMPDMSGGEALIQIRKKYPNRKVVILTTYYNQLLVEDFLSHGASAFLTKNSRIDLIADTIRLVHGNRYLKKISSPESIEINARFSKRESEIIPLICDGLSNKEVANQLRVCSKTIEAHKKNLYRKTKTKSSAEFISYIYKSGLIYLPERVG